MISSAIIRVNEKMLKFDKKANIFYDRIIRRQATI